MSSQSTTRVSAVGRTKIGLVQFPGSNCDQDTIDAFWRHFGVVVSPVWHTETMLPELDGLVLPGGFSYGDYLRSGALASHSPIMMDVRRFVQRGGAVLGICNGFQILTESHLLPGVLLRNESRSFVCKFVNLATGSGESTYQKTLAKRISRIPVAHGEGRYFIAAEGLKRLHDNGQVAFRYCTAAGRASAEANPNGSVDHIAGVVSDNGRVLGMMPHPERAADSLLGSSDGLEILRAFLASFA